MDRASEIKEAAIELGMDEVLVELPATEAAELRARVQNRFLIDGLDWWWERLKSGRSLWMGSRGWNPMDVISELCIEDSVWLMPIYDDNGEVFSAPMPWVVDILRGSSLDEFAVVASDLSWIVMVNHHDTVFGAGDRVISHLERLERRPGGGQGAAI